MSKFFLPFIKKDSISWKDEIISSFTLFFTVSYVIFVHPAILSDAGFDKTSMLTVTILVASLSTLLAGLFSNLPIFMAPGMGLNAVFAYSLILGQGIHWTIALGIVFVSGLIFFILTLFSFQDKVISSIPDGIRFGACAGIGFFLTFLGFRNLGLVQGHPVTIITFKPIHLQSLLGLIGFVFTVILHIFKVRGSLLLGIGLVTVLAVIFDPNVSLPEHWFALPASPADFSFHLDIMSVLTNIALWIPTFSFMFVDFFDSISTLNSFRSAYEKEGDQHVQSKISRALKIDSLATMFGSLIGTSTTTTYSESNITLSTKGKTGYTAIFTALLFLPLLFFAPVITIVPVYATASCLIFTGVLMMENLIAIDWKDPYQAFPAFVTVFGIPFTFSITTGLSLGFLTYFFMQVFAPKKERKKMSGTLLLVVALSALALFLQSIS